MADKKINVKKRKRGGQPGNKNAVGNRGGAPYGNKNSVTHGGYRKAHLAFAIHLYSLGLLQSKGKIRNNSNVATVTVKTA